MKNDEKFPTPRQTRIAMLFLVPAALLFGQRALLWADVTLPTPTFKDGDPLTAAQLNGNFNALKGAIEAIQAKPTRSYGSKFYSLGGVFFQATSVMTNGLALSAPGNLKGYLAAKAICQSLPGAPTTVHLCSGEELTRSEQLGINVPTGWYSLGHADATSKLNDCSGFNYNGGDANAPIWDSSSHGPSYGNCSTQVFPLLCCD